jgi:hypothetical protein
VRTVDRTERNTNEDIFRLAAEAFRRAFPGAEIETLELEPVEEIAGLRPDRLIRLTVQGQGLNYYAEIKAAVTAVTRAQELIWLAKRAQLRHPLLLVTRYVNPRMAERLREGGLEFIDAAGNAFINRPPLYVFVKGNRPPEAAMPTRPKRVFRPTGLKVIYVFLCNPGLENKTYREIAAAAGVALGTIGWFMRDLKEAGFLLDMGKRGKKLTQKGKLLQRWVTAYPEQLRPRQMLGRYKGEYGWWRNVRLDPLKAQWGGEVAAARLTQYLKPQVITVYMTAKHLDEFLLENRLKKNPDGDVELLERFWTPGETQEPEDIVHPILVYADLLSTGDERNIETAKMIYEQHIVRFIRED